jgi:hypothetical protein
MRGNEEGEVLRRRNNMLTGREARERGKENENGERKEKEGKRTRKGKRRAKEKERRGEGIPRGVAPTLWRAQRAIHVFPL